MLFVLMAVFILMIIVGIVSDLADDCSTTGFPLVCLGSILLTICFIAGVVVTTQVVDSRYIDEKISMYDAENEKIEADVFGIVESYKDYEGETFSNIADKSPIALAVLVPELKSDALVSKQIDLYVDNVNQIKELKLKSIDYKTSKWWLYFGG